MIHNIIPPMFFKPTLILVPKVFVVEFDVHIPNNSGEIYGNVAWKLENVVTTLNRTINNISIIFSSYFQTRYTFAVFSFRMRYI